MALAVDATSNSGLKNPGDPWTWSHTVSGSNTDLVVGISYYTSGITISSVVYNGDAMTNIAGATIINGSFGVAFYNLINPDTGTHDITVDMSTSAYGSSGAISFTGADQTTQPDVAAEESGSSATTNVLNITTTTDDTYIVDGICLDTTFSNNDLNEAVSQTEITRQFTAFADTGFSYKAAASAGAQTMTWTWTVAFSTASYAHAGIAVKAAAGGGVTIRNLAALGVG